MELKCTLLVLSVYLLLLLELIVLKVVNFALHQGNVHDVKLDWYLTGKTAL